MASNSIGDPVDDPDYGDEEESGVSNCDCLCWLKCWKLTINC